MIRKHSAYLPITRRLEELKAGMILENTRLGSATFFFVEHSHVCGSSTTYERYLRGTAGCHSGEKPRFGDDKAGGDT